MTGFGVLALIAIAVMSIGAFFTQPAMAFSMLGLLYAVPVFVHWGLGWFVGYFTAMLGALLSFAGGVWLSFKIGSAFGVEPDSGIILVVLGLVLFLGTILTMHEELLPIKYSNYE